MNRFTKSVVIVSTLTAAVAQSYLATMPVFPQVFQLALGGALVALVAGAWSPGVVSAIILLAPYLSPSAFVLWTGTEHFSLETVWALPLLGLAVAGRGAWQWSLPDRWQWPLGAWSLIVAVSWPIVFLREIDFNAAVLPMGGVANTSIGMTPGDAGLTVTYFVLAHNLGLLWIDALFRWFTEDDREVFARRILYPLATAGIVASAVGVYQGFVDLSFLGVHLWPHMGRASGTLGDANSFGLIAALWAPAIVLLARDLAQPWAAIFGGGGLLVAGAGVYVSGSRTAMLTLIVGLGTLAAAGWRIAQARRKTRAPRTVRVAAWLAGGAAVVVLAAIVSQGAGTTSILARGGLFPGSDRVGITGSLVEYFNRFGYGPAATDMIREHPVAGVGVGSFHTLVHDFGTLRGRDLPPDNAQNWFRHQLAELGVLGSLAWMAWCLSMAIHLLGSSRWDRDAQGARVLRGSLLAFGFIALVGTPGQALPVVVTFWTFVFWHVQLKGGALLATVRSYTWSPITWAATAVLVLAHAGMTYADARGALLPRHRAERFGWDYRYGIGNLEPSPDGGPGRRWTGLTSLSVIKVEGRVLKFVAWIDHPDADERPVRVRVRADSAVVYDDDLKRSAAITLDIPARAGATHMVIETEISRTWKPTDFGRDDRRELGLSIRDWVWE